MNMRFTKEPDRGITLLEIIIVTSIMAVLMGISIGFISKLNRVIGLKAEAARVNAVLRQARNTATTDETETVVRLDPLRNRIHVLRWRTVGQWHFEDDVSQGFGNDASPNGARLTEDSNGGRFGRCFIFEKGATVNCGNISTFNLRLGLSFEAYVFPFDGEHMIVIQKGKGFICTIEGGYFCAKLRNVGQASSGQRKLPVPMGRWSNVRMTFDSQNLKVYVNGALGGVFPPVKKKKKKKKKKDGEPEPVKVYEFSPDEEADLIIGGARGRFRGKIDEVRFAGITNEDAQELAASVEILADQTTDLEIHFTPSGRLDSTFHDKPVTIVLAARAEKTKKEIITVTLTGMVE
jgi:competence protein ComGC